jgi:hypothetical protein
VKTRIALAVVAVAVVRWLRSDWAASWEGGAILPWPRRSDPDPCVAFCHDRR